MSFFGSAEPRRPLSPIDLEHATLALDASFPIMGVVNVTPDSFSDGGEYFDADRAVAHGQRLADEGAHILDIGGESTRPGADPVSVEEELDRTLEVIERLRSSRDVAISIDTYKARVAERALDAGADLVNDISGLGFDDEMAGVVADSGAAIVIMHIQGTPETMQRDIAYDDVVDDVRAYFEERIDLAVRSGIDPGRIIVDPGIGFGKTVAQNYRLIRELSAFFEFDCPILLGTSRKSLIGAVLEKPADQRLMGTAATVACGLYAGADIVRVHDVGPMRDVVEVTEALAGMTSP